MPNSTPSVHGFLVIDKPPGLTSRDVVNRAAGWFPRRTRLGHAGTLDPLATGVLPLALGSATRLIEYIQRWDKVYEAGIRLGGVSDTDDSTGIITPRAVDRPPQRTELDRVLAEFVGTIDQVPPAYSAAKVTGRRAYDLARAGRELELAPRRVRIDAIEVLDYDYPQLAVRVHCGKGTYIRSLARDLGERLGCGGYIDRLRRTRVGRFTVEEAISLEADRATALGRLQPMEIAVADLPQLTLDDALLARLRRGAPVALAGLGQSVPGQAAEAAVLTACRRLAAVARLDRQRELLRPCKVFDTGPCQ